jgi:hypothetical protein
MADKLLEVLRCDCTRLERATTKDAAAKLLNGIAVYVHSSNRILVSVTGSGGCRTPVHLDQFAIIQGVRY